jgi:alpha/beta superfamily hydrolase
VAISVSNGEFADTAKFHFPVLDIYGERDFPLLLQKAGARAAAISKHRGSAQIEVAGSDHYFTGREAELARHVRLFLDRALH